MTYSTNKNYSIYIINSEERKAEILLSELNLLQKLEKSKIEQLNMIDLEKIKDNKLKLQIKLYKE